MNKQCIVWTLCVIILCIALIAITSGIWILLLHFAEDTLPSTIINLKQITSERLTEQRILVDSINNASTTWKAKFNPDATIQNIFSSEAAWVAETDSQDWRTLPARHVANSLMIQTGTEDVLKKFGIGNPDISKVPRAFDAREKWSHCASVHRPNTEQGACGSCWAVAGAAVISDRICIHSNGKHNVYVSPEEIVDCNEFSYGCDGGRTYVPFLHWMSRGVVTGGPYQSGQGCQPYNYTTECGKPCARFQFLPTHKCQDSCVPGYSKSYEDDKHHASTTYRVVPHPASNVTMVQLMQWEIMERGPVAATMDVLVDLLHYDSGVYQYVSGAYVYGHVVRIVGWGEERINGKNVPYWMVANSFGDTWGLGGFFKILRGENHLGIEQWAFAGLPRV